MKERRERRRIGALPSVAKNLDGKIQARRADKLVHPNILDERERRHEAVEVVHCNRHKFSVKFVLVYDGERPSDE